MAGSRKSYNKGSKKLPLDTAKPFSKVGEKPSDPGSEAKGMHRKAMASSPKGAAKLKQPRGL